MNTEEWMLIISALTLIFTALGTYIAYTNKRGNPKSKKCKHDKSNRHVLRKLSVAFIIKVTKD